MAALSDDIGAKVSQYISRLQECSHTHWNISGSVIKKNISRICQDQVRLQEVCRGIESLMQENDPFSFIEVRVPTPRGQTGRTVCPLENRRIINHKN